MIVILGMPSTLSTRCLSGSRPCRQSWPSRGTGRWGPGRQGTVSQRSASAWQVILTFPSDLDPEENNKASKDSKQYIRKKNCIQCKVKIGRKYENIFKTWKIKMSLFLPNFCQESESNCYLLLLSTERSQAKKKNQVASICWILHDLLGWAAWRLLSSSSPPTSSLLPSLPGKREWL